MPDIDYPTGGGGKWPVKANEPEQTQHVALLCDGTVMRFTGMLEENTLAVLNSLAADRLVDRIAKRVVEMQAETSAPQDKYVQPWPSLAIRYRSCMSLCS